MSKLEAAGLIVAFFVVGVMVGVVCSDSVHSRNEIDQEQTEKFEVRYKCEGCDGYLTLKQVVHEDCCPHCGRIRSIVLDYVKESGRYVTGKHRHPIEDAM